MERSSPREDPIAVAYLHTDDTNPRGSQAQYHARRRTSAYTTCIVHDRGRPTGLHAPVHKIMNAAGHPVRSRD